jgi:hypothetical protein
LLKKLDTLKKDSGNNPIFDIMKLFIDAIGTFMPDNSDSSGLSSGAVSELKKLQTSLQSVDFVNKIKSDLSNYKESTDIKALKEICGFPCESCKKENCEIKNVKNAITEKGLFSALYFFLEEEKPFILEIGNNTYFSFDCIGGMTKNKAEAFRFRCQDDATKMADDRNIGNFKIINTLIK